MLAELFRREVQWDHWVRHPDTTQLERAHSGFQLWWHRSVEGCVSLLAWLEELGCPLL